MTTGVHLRHHDAGFVLELVHWGSLASERHSGIPWATGRGREDVTLRMPGGTILLMASASIRSRAAHSYGWGRPYTGLVMFIVSAWVVGSVLCVGPAEAQGTVETQKGPPPAPAPSAPQSAPPPAGAVGRPAIEPEPGTPALAPVPGTVDGQGRPVPGARRIFGLRPPILMTGLGVLIALILVTYAMRRRARGDRRASQ